MGNVLYRMRFRLDHRWAPAHMSDYLDEELDTRRRRRLERHVGQCEECDRLLAGLRAMLRLLHALTPPSGDVDVARIAASARLRIEEPPGRP